MFRSAILAIAAVYVAFAQSSPQKTPPSAPPTFYKNVLPIFQNHCQSCHRPGEIGPMPLITYDQARPWADAIAHAVEMKMMPPWFADARYGHFANDNSLNDAQIAAITAWARAGAPAGSPYDAPPPPTWAGGWNIPQPDLIVRMPKPVPIPAAGEVEYTYEIVPTHFAEDRWVQMSEFRPGSAAHVHHAVVYIRPPDSPWLRHAPVGRSRRTNVDHGMMHVRRAAGTKFRHLHPAVFSKVRGHDLICVFDLACGGNRHRLRHPYDKVRLGNIPAAGPGWRRRSVVRAACGCACAGPGGDGGNLRVVKRIVVGEMAVSCVGEPGRHHLHFDRVRDRIGPRARLVIGDERHGADFAGAMAALAVVLKDG